MYLLNRWVDVKLCTLIKGIDQTLNITINPTGNDLFLECEIHSYLLVLLRLYCQEETQSSVDFSDLIPGVVSFSDL